MKKVVPYFQYGQKVNGSVEEIHSTGHLIVAFNGDLIRVVNSANLRLKKGDRLELYVWAVDPLEFRLTAPKPKGFERTI